MADPPKRLYRSRTDRMICGVCGGLAKYLNTDPAIIRIATVVLGVMTGGGVVIAYVIALFVIPEEPESL